jgi:hypothetical protein
MICFFTIPKPFRGHTGIIQRNALRCWRRLGDCEILVFGDDEGTAQAAAEIGASHVPTLQRTAEGTPIISGVFQEAERLARRPVMCYVNADILFLPDILTAAGKLPPTPALMVGRRIDLEVPEEIDWTTDRWAERLGRRARTHGRPHGDAGLDYFIYRPGLWKRIPPFAVGRTSWDNWLLYDVRARRAALIDATDAVTAIHQNHDYDHVVGGRQVVWEGPDAVRNQALSGGPDHWFTVLDATHRLDGNGLQPTTGDAYLERLIHNAPSLFFKHRVLRRLSRGLLRRLWSGFPPSVRNPLFSGLARWTR